MTQESVGISNRLLTPCHTRLRRPPRGPFSYQGVSTRGVRHSPGTILNRTSENAFTKVFSRPNLCVVFFSSPQKIDPHNNHIPKRLLVSPPFLTLVMQYFSYAIFFVCNIGLQSPPPPTKYKTTLSPKVHPKIHPESPPKTKIRKKKRKMHENRGFHKFVVFFCILVSGVYFGVCFGAQRGFVICRGRRRSKI